MISSFSLSLYSNQAFLEWNNISGQTSYVHTSDAAERHAVSQDCMAVIVDHSVWRNHYVQGHCQAMGQAARCEKHVEPGGGRCRWAQSRLHHHSLSSGYRHQRKPHGLCGRPGQEAVAAAMGTRKHRQIFHTSRVKTNHGKQKAANHA